MDCKSSERGRSSIRSNSPPRTNCGKKSSPRANSSASPKANSAMPYMSRTRLTVHSPIEPKRSNMSNASSGSVATNSAVVSSAIGQSVYCNCERKCSRI